MWHQHLLDSFLDRYCPASNHTVAAVGLVSDCRADSRPLSSLACSEGVSGAPKVLRSAAAAPASRGSGQAAAVQRRNRRSTPAHAQYPFVAKPLKHSHALPVERLRHFVVLLVPSQVSKSASEPAIPIDRRVRERCQDSPRRAIARIRCRLGHAQRLLGS